jgi:hypothetical protein
VVDVEGEPNGHTAAGSVGDRACHELRSRLLEVEVVEREIKGLPRLRDELTGELRDLEGGLAPVGQRPDPDRQP